MSLQPLDLTTALRPSLLPDETLLFVQDAVGLYEGYMTTNIFLFGPRRLTASAPVQKVQDPSLPEWSCVFDFASSMLCRQH